MNISINLLPWRQEEKLRKKKVFLGIVALCLSLVGLGLLGLNFSLDFEILKHKNKQAELNIALSNLEEKLTKLSNIEKEKTQLLARIESFNHLEHKVESSAKLLELIALTVPSGIYLTKLNYTGEHVKLEGRAISSSHVAQLLQNIEACNCFIKPKLNYIELKDKKKPQAGLRFSLELNYQ